VLRGGVLAVLVVLVCAARAAADAPTRYRGRVREYAGLLRRAHARQLAPPSSPPAAERIASPTPYVARDAGIGLSYVCLL
jgi:hypothetical protein